MRKVILTAALIFVWAHPIYARPRTACCQLGTTYGSSSAENTVSCKVIAITGKAGKACRASGGAVTAGPCDETDGVCGGSTTCCEGVSIGQACSGFAGEPATALPNSCAAANEAACDALSPDGEVATKSVPGATCTVEKAEGGSFCITPTP